MVFHFRILSAFFCLSLGLVPAFSQDSQGWVQGLHSRVQLVSGDKEAGRSLAGIEIALDPGFKTYWRDPGESGLPPRFDWSGSENVKSLDIRWPAPSRSQDAAGISYVYHDGVLLPVIVEAEDPAKPIRLSLNIEYGICKDICIPANAKLERVLGTGPSRQSDIAAVLSSKVPRVQAIGATGDLSILAAESGSQAESGFTAVLRAPAGLSPTLFVEGPEGWYFSTGHPDDQNRIAVTLDEKPKDAAGDVSVRLTLVAGEKSVESVVRLDASGKPR